MRLFQVAVVRITDERFTNFFLKDLPPLAIGMGVLVYEP
jgi:hypothetical protein